MTSDHKIILIEFNEVNFELLNQYLSDPLFAHRWLNLRKLQCEKSVVSHSEAEYEYLEPWIQWASVHTGLTAKQHGVFRLGDISLCSKPQIFEILEGKGLKVGCISAMNATNRLVDPAYFIPDPWTITDTDGSFTSDAVYRALYQAVNDNSAGKLTLNTILNLLVVMGMHAKVRNWVTYIKLFFKSLRKKSWNKALFLDLFISDLHLSLCGANTPQFSTVFFNGFAHLQHHYFFASKYYTGEQVNPGWYLPKDNDPFLDALDIYDLILGQQIEYNQEYEVLIATGLQQVPYEKTTFYYRLRQHTLFLKYLGISDVKVLPRMTRDFLIGCRTNEHAEQVAQILDAVMLNDFKVFGEIDNRGKSLFVTLTYPIEITKDDVIYSIDTSEMKLIDHVVFVAIKNGMHDPTGYVYSTDPGETFERLDGQHVKSLFNYIKERLLPAS